MAEDLGDRLAAQCLATWGPSAFDAVVPVPMPSLRRIWRGIDHSAALAARVSKAFGVPMTRLLVHVGGRTQVGRSRTERLRRRSPFRIHPSVIVRARGLQRLVLVDDVRSTGSTLQQAARVLQASLPGVEIRVAVAAIAELELRDHHCRPRNALDSWHPTE